LHGRVGRPIICVARVAREVPMAVKSAGTSEVIIEMRPVGAVVRVAAVDVASGVEVIVFGPATAPQKALEDLAVAKLKRRLSTGSGS
jgi:hypothetical protein